VAPHAVGDDVQTMPIEQHEAVFVVLSALVVVSLFSSPDTALLIERA